MMHEWGIAQGSCAGSESSSLQKALSVRLVPIVVKQRVAAPSVCLCSHFCRLLFSYSFRKEVLEAGCVARAHSLEIMGCGSFSWHLQP